jgi:8-oxo-dGTP pyrophosphatase MutT (NUDIX family)
MAHLPVLQIDRLVLGYSPWRWPFAQEHRRDIEAHFIRAQKQKPELWNGRVLMLRDYAIDGRVFRGRYFETDFANLLAWRDWDFPDATVKNSFAMGALRSSDGAFVLGRMGVHTANAGLMYFPAGTPDPEDVQHGNVDLLGSVMREVEEETGLTSQDYTMQPGWLTVLAGPRIAHMRVLQARMPADELRTRIRSYLAAQKQPELSDVRIVRSPVDISPTVPPFVTSFLNYIWSSR